MFLKQTSYKPRSNSQSAQDAAARAAATGQAAPAQTSSSPPPRKSVEAPARKSSDLTNPAYNAAAAGRRRSSASSSTKFAGLHQYKRNSQDADAQARKAAYHEQAVGQGGVLSGIWSSFTKGTGTGTNK